MFNHKSLQPDVVLWQKGKRVYQIHLSPLRTTGSFYSSAFPLAVYLWCLVLIDIYIIYVFYLVSISSMLFSIFQLVIFKVICLYVRLLVMRCYFIIQLNYILNNISQQFSLVSLCVQFILHASLSAHHLPFISFYLHAFQFIPSSSHMLLICQHTTLPQ